MGLRYTYPKEKLNFKIHNLYIFFYDGNYISISEQEIVSANINYYDKPIWEEDCYCPVAESGFIKLKIGDTKPRFRYGFLHDESKFIKDRKSYIENRCVNEGQIKRITLFNEHYHNLTIYGHMVANLEDGYLVIKFLPNAMYGSANNKDISIDINNVNKPYILKVLLDFENCEDCAVYDDEIVDVKLTFSKELEWDSGSLCRRVNGGYLRIKLDKTINSRDCSFHSNKKPTVKQIQRRLCGKKGEDIHDICHLLITYDYAGYGITRKESLCIYSVPFCDLWDGVEGLDDENSEGMYWFISGYSKKLSDGSVLIAFGEQAKTTVEKYIEKMEE
jgi:hypothetical protein